MVRGAPSARRSTFAATGIFVSTVLPSALVTSLVLSIRQDFEFSAAQLGVAAGILYGVAAVMSAASEAIVRRTGIEYGVYTASAIVTACSLVIAVVVDSAAALIATMAVLGIASGLASPTLAALLARDVPDHRRGAAYGLFTAAPLIAVSLGGIAVPLIAETIGWRWAFVAVAAVVPGLAVLVPRQRPHRPDAGRAGSSTRGLPAQIYLMAAATGMASAAGLGMRAFLVVFAVSEGFEPAEAGGLLAALGAVAMFSRIGSGWLGDRWPRSTLTIAAGLLLVSGSGFLIMAAATPPLIVVGALLAGGFGWGWQAPLVHAAVEQSRNAPVAAVGIQNTGFYVGAIAGPITVGIFAEAGELTAAWLACGGLVAGAAMVSLIARALSHRDYTARITQVPPSDVPG